MAGKELYNVDIQINVNGVDKGTSDLKKMDKALSNLEKNAKKKIKPKVDTSAFEKATGQANKASKAYQSMARGYGKSTANMLKSTNMMRKNMAMMGNQTATNMAKMKSSIDINMNKAEKSIKASMDRTSKILSGRQSMLQNQAMFKNHSLDLMMGKAAMVGGQPLKITATENVTQTVAKAKASMQNLKASSNVKATLKARANQALETINRTRNKAKEYASGKYEAILTAKEKLSGTVFGRMHSAVGGAIRKAGRIVSMGASALGGIGITKMVKTFADYSSQMSKLKAVTDMTAREFKILDTQAKHLGATTEWSASQVAQGMTELGQAGFASKEIYSAMPGLLNLASAGGLQLAEASGIASGTLRAFNLEAGKTGHVANVLAKTASATNSEVNEIGNSMEYAAPYAKMLNVSLEDTAAAIGMLSQVNIKGSKAGMGLRGMFTSLMAPTAGAKKVMDKFGFSAFDATGKMKPFPQVIQELDKSLSKLNPQQKGEAINKMFGDVAGGSIQALLNLGPDKLAKLTKELEYSQGAAEKMAKTRLDNLAGDFTILKSAVEGSMISLGQKLEPQLRQFVQWLTGKIPDIENAISSAIDFFSEHQNMIIGGLKTIIPLILGIHGAVSALSAIASIGNIAKDFGLLKEAISGIAGVAGSVSGSAGGLAAALGGISVGTVAIFAVVAALGALGVAISDNVGLCAELQGALGGLGGPITGILESFGGLMKMSLGSGGQFLLGTLKTIGKLLTGDFKGALAEAEHAGANVRSSWVDGYSDLCMQTSKATKAIGRMTKEELKPIKGAFSTALGQTQNIVKGNYKEMGQAMSTSLNGMSNDQLNILRGTSRNMEQLLAGVHDKMSSSDIASKIKNNMESLSKVSGFDPKNMAKDFRNALADIEKYSGASASQLKSNFSNIFNGFKNIAMAGDVKGGVEKMIQDIHSAGPAIQSAIQSNQTAMQGLFNGVDFSSGIKQQVDQVMKNLGQMNPAQATEAMRGLFSQLGNGVSQQAQQAGQQAGEQFSQGMNQAMAQGGGEGSNPAMNMFTQQAETLGAQAQQAGVQTGQQFGQGMTEGMAQAQTQMQASMTQNNQMVTQANQMATGVKQAYTNMYNGASNSVSQLASRTTSTFSALSASATAQVTSMCSRIIAAWNAMKAVVSATVTAHFVLSVSTVGGMGAVPHADGGILTEPHIGLVAEAGPEAVIPLSPGKRARGIELFKQAGQMLGITESSDGGANNGLAEGIADKNFKPDNSNTFVQGGNGGNTVNVNVNVDAGGLGDKQAIIDEAVDTVRLELEDALGNLA
ncbi:phage tail tape measure protein [Peptostreptococcus anaerobius]